ncbi:MAG: hypothetical protein M1517_05730 [Deltaproteobacteria bacterium]|nr:hypothetical protein [Deltaproteobacteria bacterium]
MKINKWLLLMTVSLLIIVDCTNSQRSSLSWQVIGTMPEGRSNFSAVISKYYSAPYGELFVCASYLEPYVQVIDMNLDGSLGAWRMSSLESWIFTVNPPSLARAEFAAVTYMNKIYAFGGLDYTLTTTSPNLTNLTEYITINSDGTLDQWQSTTPMVIPRAGLQAAMYNGYTYVIGGYTGRPFSPNVVTASVEYTPINPDGTLGQWQTTTSMNLPRAEFGTIAANGWMYAIGGNTPNGSTNTVEYTSINPNGTLGMWQSATSLLMTTGAGLAVTSSNGWIYALGGGTDKVEMARMNPDGTLGQWQYTAQMNEVRANFNAAIVNNRIYAIGGDTENTVEYADINTDGTLGPWNIILSTSSIMFPDMSAVSYQDHIYLLGGGGTLCSTWMPVSFTQSKIYIIGGNAPTTTGSIAFANIISGTTLSGWTETTGLWEPRAGFGAVATDGVFYAVGGENAGNALNNLEIINPVNLSEIGGGADESGTLKKGIVINAMHDIPAGSATLFTCGIYIIGGKSNSRYLNEVGTIVDNDIWRGVYSCNQLYLLLGLGSELPLVRPGLSFTYEATSSLNIPRYKPSAVNYDNYVYAIGGYYTGTSITNSVEMAQVQTDGTLGQWQYTSPMNLPRAGFAAVAISGWVYAVGGYTDKGITNSVEKAPIDADGTLGKWVFTTPLVIPRADLAVVEDNGWIYALGGVSKVGGPPLDTIEALKATR